MIKIIKEINCSVDNENIYGQLYIPDDNKDKLPIVILSHGLSLNHTYMKPYAEKLLKYNIPSFIFDFRGGGYGCLSDGKISDMSLYTEITDLNKVIDTIKTFNCIDKNKIYLAGHSQGGFISSLVAAKRINEIQGLFLFAPAYVICDDVKNMTNMRKKNVLTLMPEYTKETYITAAKKVKLYDDITPFNKEVHIFHGKKDSRVPLSYATEASNEYSNCNLTIFNNEEHRFTDKTKDIVVEKIHEIIQKDN